MITGWRWALALAACTLWGCAAISGLGDLDVVGDASTFDATKPDASVADAAADSPADSPTADVAQPPKDSGTDTSPPLDAGCGSGIPCAAEQGGCCNASETCGLNGCCKGIGGSCFSNGSCCSGMVCTTGGTCQSACTPLDAGCQTGSQDKCCRGQAYCNGNNNRCATCIANDAGCSGDQQCCSQNCSQTSNVCKP